MTDRTVRCAECDLESKIDIDSGNVQSFMVPKAEMKRRCKLANNPSFNFKCPHFDKAINAAILPSV
jgi:hypothetical protein